MVCMVKYNYPDAYPYFMFSYEKATMGQIIVRLIKLIFIDFRIFLFEL